MHFPDKAIELDIDRMKIGLVEIAIFSVVQCSSCVGVPAVVWQSSYCQMVERHLAQ